MLRKGGAGAGSDPRSSAAGGQAPRSPGAHSPRVLASQPSAAKLARALGKSRRAPTWLPRGERSPGPREGRSGRAAAPRRDPLVPGPGRPTVSHPRLRLAARALREPGEVGPQVFSCPLPAKDVYLRDTFFLQFGREKRRRRV
uniref:Uncharacterized protein n=1 Tax=Rangifer tarandus platyrhynchus TaxID=3082113 RepID=A0ACB0EKS9_RANTA|nr:unnamed protein product [Rangifer tarandus platyrhynchus]